MRSKISLDEEEQNEIKKQNQFSHELNKTAIRMKELEEEFTNIIDKKNIENIYPAVQNQIIEVANQMEILLKGQINVISDLLSNKKED